MRIATTCTVALWAAASAGGAAAQEGGAPPVATPQATRTEAGLPEELRDAFTRTLAATSYAFECVLDSSSERGGARDEGAGGAAGAGGEAPRGPPREPTRIAGLWQAGKPTSVAIGELAGFRLDDQLVYRRGDDGGAIWKRFDSTSALIERGGGGRGGAQAGEQGGAQGGGAPATGSGGASPPSGTPSTSGGAMVPGGIPMRGLMQSRTLLQLAGVRAPHELIARIDALGGATFERVEAEGRVLWRAKLPPQLADDLGGVDRLRRLGAQSGRGGGNVDVDVTVELTLAGGRIATLDVLTVVHGQRRGDSLRTTRYALERFDEVTLEVPKAVLDLLAT